MKEQKQIKTYYLIFILVLLLTGNTSVFAALSADQKVSATLTRPGGGGGGGGGGGIIAGGAVAGGAASGATALAFAPILLAGLEPNSVICAAAPIECINEIGDFLQCAIVNHFGSTQDIITAMKNMQTGAKKYLAQNNTEIINGTFDIQSIEIPKEFWNSQKIKINITVVSQPYNEVSDEPELKLTLYKDITTKDLSKKFETQQFLHHYLMKKYDSPLSITLKAYNKGVQKLTGIIDMKQIQNPQKVMHIVVRYTEGGFRKNLKNQNPKTIRYAYLVEFEKIR